MHDFVRYQSKNIDDHGIGSRFYGLQLWWMYVAHFAGKPYLLGRAATDSTGAARNGGSATRTHIAKTRFYLAQEGLDFGELYGNFVAHRAVWDLPYIGHLYREMEQSPFQGIGKWCTASQSLIAQLTN